jgi:hypothetical protein
MSGWSCVKCTLTRPFIFSAVIFQTFSQLCASDYETKTVQIYKAPWYNNVDKPRFAYLNFSIKMLLCSLLKYTLADTSRHHLPINVIKQIIESMSYAKLVSNVVVRELFLHYHSFPLLLFYRYLILDITVSRMSSTGTS